MLKTNNPSLSNDIRSNFTLIRTDTIKDGFDDCIKETEQFNEPF